MWQDAPCCAAYRADRPLGILLYGRDLHGGQGLDALVGHVTICGKPIPSFEALVAAVDAAGRRARRRLLIVIDGLNEARIRATGRRRWRR